MTKVRLTDDEVAMIDGALSHRARFLRKEFQGLEKDADKLESLRERIQIIQWNSEEE